MLALRQRRLGGFEDGWFSAMLTVGLSNAWHRSSTSAGEDFFVNSVIWAGSETFTNALRGIRISAFAIRGITSAAIMVAKTMMPSHIIRNPLNIVFGATAPREFLPYIFSHPTSQDFFLAGFSGLQFHWTIFMVIRQFVSFRFCLVVS